MRRDEMDRNTNRQPRYAYNGFSTNTRCKSRPLKIRLRPSNKTLRYQAATKTSRRVSPTRPARIIEYNGGHAINGQPRWSYRPLPSSRFWATAMYLTESEDTPA